MAGHKYIRKYWKNGRWNYVYKNDQTRSNLGDSTTHLEYDANYVDRPLPAVYNFNPNPRNKVYGQKARHRRGQNFGAAVKPDSSFSKKTTQGRQKIGKLVANGANFISGRKKAKYPYSPSERERNRDYSSGIASHPGYKPMHVPRPHKKGARKKSKAEVFISTFTSTFVSTLLG